MYFLIFHSHEAYIYNKYRVLKLLNLSSNLSEIRVIVGIYNLTQFCVTTCCVANCGKSIMVARPRSCKNTPLSIIICYIVSCDIKLFKLCVPNFTSAIITIMTNDNEMACRALIRKIVCSVNLRMV